MTVMLVFSMTASRFEWNYIPSFISVEKVIQLGNKVYFLSCGNLYFYDKNKGVVSHYDIQEQSGLIVSIYCDDDLSRMAIALENGYIDIVEKNGDSYVLSGLSGLKLSSDTVIYNMSFDGNNLLVTSCKGPVIYDLKSRKITKSANLQYPINTFIATDSCYLLTFDHSLYRISKTADLRDKANYKRLTYSDCIDLYSVEDQSIVYGISENDRGRRLIRYDFTDGDVKVKEYAGEVKLPYIIKGYNGEFFVVIDSELYSFNDKGEVISVIPTKFDILAVDGDKRLWACSSEGGLLSVVESNGKIKKEGESIIPDAIRVKSADILKFDYDKGLLVGSLTPYSRFNLIEDKTVSTPIDYLNDKIDFDTVLNLSDLAIHPVDNQYVFAGSFSDGIVRLKNGKKDYVSLNKGWGCSAQGLCFDNENNLWVATGFDSNTPLMMLPADKTLGNFNVSDWYVPDLKSFSFQIDGRVNIVGDIVAVTSSDYHCGLLLYNRSTAKNIHLTTFIDSDLFSFEPDYIYKTFADSRGRLWCLTSSGIFYIKDVSNIFSSTDPIVVRPKIDGSTMMADYALNGVDVVDMTEDRAGQLYFATRDDGIYMFDSDCSNIINHFTMSNSPLVSNNIKSIMTDTRNGNVYVGTPTGLFRIECNDLNLGSNLSDIKIYPNPVKPGYNGLITIENVPDNSFIKIVDTTGNNMLSMTSTGNRSVFNSSQLSSGIFNVVLSTIDGQSKIIGKIMIIR